jgi:predicted HicB family RNase H-like nuclease
VAEAKKTKKPGRPKLPKGEAKAGYLRVRLTAEEVRRLEAAAKASKQTVSEWVRGKINATI